MNPTAQIESPRWWRSRFALILLVGWLLLAGLWGHSMYHRSQLSWEDGDGQVSGVAGEGGSLEWFQTRIDAAKFMHSGLLSPMPPNEAGLWGRYQEMGPGSGLGHFRQRSRERRSIWPGWGACVHESAFKGGLIIRTVRISYAAIGLSFTAVWAAIGVWWWKRKRGLT